MGNDKKIPATNAKINEGSINGMGVDTLKGSRVSPEVSPAKRRKNQYTKLILFERKNTHPTIIMANVYTWRIGRQTFVSQRPKPRLSTANATPCINPQAIKVGLNPCQRPVNRKTINILIC